MAYFGMQTLYIYTEIYGANGVCFGIRPEMTVYDWYTTGIWCPGICITTSFFAVTRIRLVQNKNCEHALCLSVHSNSLGSRSHLFGMTIRYSFG